MFCPECGNHAANKALRKLIENGQGGVAREVFTYDGTKSSELAVEGIDFAYVSTKPIDPYTIVSVTASIAGNNLTTKGSDLIIVKSEQAELGYGYTVFAPYEGTNIPIISIAYWIDGNVSVAVLSTDDSYISRIETETIHTIDQKYLPEDMMTKVIDLSQYGSATDSISNVILWLFQTGGSSHAFDDVGSFWEDVKTERILTLQIPMGSLEFIVTAPVIYREASSKKVYQVAFSVMLYENTKNSTHNINVVINRYEGSNGATVYVKVS